ncbi:hypothetical protein CPC08DRAFT_815682 [Agrocybe pediades]|nr:hypothetical protein CPC08DRAFT_815682 [Agrocybe pediades]
MATWRNFKGLVYKPGAAVLVRKPLTPAHPPIHTRLFSQPATMSAKPYIVVFKDDVTTEQISKYAEELQTGGGSIKDRFDQNGGILNGFAASIPDAYFNRFQSLTNDVIAYIEPDSEVKIQS